MSLRDDVNAGLAELGQAANFPVPLLDEGGRSRLPVRVPSALSNLRDGQLIIDVQLARNGETFALSSPIAGLTRTARAAFLEGLLRRQQINGGSRGLGFALEADNQYDLLLATYQWILPSLTTEQFMRLYQWFLTTVLDVIDEVNEMIDSTPDVEAVHVGRPR